MLDGAQNGLADPSTARSQDLIGDIDVILVSNSYWIGEDIPCLTFGLRGVIHATLKVRCWLRPARGAR